MRCPGHIVKFWPTVGAATVLSYLAITPALKGADYWMYVGTYTRNGSEGIYVCRYHSANGRVEPAHLAAEILNPAFLAIHPNQKFLYAVNENKDSLVTGFQIDRATGMLAKINSASSGGSRPCFVTVDHSGKNVLVANYDDGVIAVLPIDAEGRLRESTSVIHNRGSGPDPVRQAGPHAHSINLSPDNRFATATDLGLDEVFVYKFDAAAGTLTPNQTAYSVTPPGSGPRHLSFSPDGKFAYVIEEMGGAVTVFRYETDGGALTPIETVSTLPEGFRGQNFSAEILVHPSGKFVYASNRGPESITVFLVFGAHQK
jgi:6-phosphogluconolactonase